MDRGFDEFVQFGTGGAPTRRSRLRRAAERHGFLPKNKGTASTTEAVTAWLRGRRPGQEPFFLAVHYHEAHHPYWAPAAYRGIYAAGRLRRSSVVRRVNRNPHLYFTQRLKLSAADLRSLSDLYDEEVRYLDLEHLSAVLRALGERSLLDSTLLIVLSPHGENIGEHGMVSHIASLHEPIVHVPMIVRHPSASRGVRTPDLVQVTDILPTVLEIVGQNVPQDLDGMAISAFVRDARPRLFAAAHWSGGGFSDADLTEDAQLYADRKTILARLKQDQFMLCNGRFKYIWHADGTGALFDIAADRAELTNLVAARRDLAQQFHRILMSMRSQPGPAGRARMAADVPGDVAEHLRSMGYTL
jgi:arylsulfatase A-like enzyme